MKSFKFRYSLTIYIMLIAVSVMALVGVIWNVFNLIAFISSGWEKVVSYAIIIALTLMLLVFSLSVLFYGRYVVKKGYLISYFGFVKTKMNINDVTEFTLFKKSNKLVVYFSDDSYTVIVISPDEYEAFVLAVREVNPKILYDVQIDGEDTPQ